MKIRYAVLGGLLASALWSASPAQAAPVQFDLSDKFNADVVVNAKDGTIDTSQSAVDGGSYSLATQGGLDEGCVSPWDPPVKGLPNNGKFDKNDDHPTIQLAYRNSNNGNNARRMEVDQKFSFSVPQDKYKKVHLLGLSGDGISSVEVTFTYKDDSTTVRTFTMGDWFQDPPSGSYTLIDHMDRMNPAGTECDESPHEFSDAAVLGRALNPNKEKTLRKITVQRVHGSEYTILTVLGATGVKA